MGQQRFLITLTGAVQGVGFRPFVYRLAVELGLAGWVRNTAGGLEIAVEGGDLSVQRFLNRLSDERPVAAAVFFQEVSRLAPIGLTGFAVRDSEDGAEKTAAVLPDLATCPECLRELLDRTNRRYGYPFTNCTRCGPRYTIVLGIPYDRPRTTMAVFALCEDCRREYEDPSNRRFHAQPNACPRCGPQLEMSVERAAQILRTGGILALKGIGGYQLLVDARNEEAVERLRTRKRRDAKPFALMMPSLETARRFCRICREEGELLTSAAAPIVLLKPAPGSGIAAAVVRESPFLGVMLPCSPLHHLLLREFPYPVVATSGNLADEPIAIDNEEAQERLETIADAFLGHNRPIARPCDDSVARLSRGSPMLLRRARGYAPLPVPVGQDLPPVLAVGGHLKNTVALALGRQVVVSQHIGDLDTLEARRSFELAIDDLCRLYDFKPQAVVCDLHPDYASSQWARRSGLPVIAVQHHQAHVAACAAENQVPEPYLGVAWDGTGYGLDGTVWGGEFFHVEAGEFARIAHLRLFPLPGGEAAIREGWRVAASLQLRIGRDSDAPDTIRQMLARQVNCPLTSSVGRLFDGIAAMLGVARENRFEGQAAMLLEWTIGSYETDRAYPLPGGDWEPTVRAVLDDLKRGKSAGEIAAVFHNGLVEWIRQVARESGLRRVIMSGGAFQNRYLTERAASLLEQDGFHVFTHQRVPPNDGGISLGQAVLAAGG